MKNSKTLAFLILLLSACSHGSGSADAPPRAPAQEKTTLGFSNTEKMDLDRLKLEAFTRCQGDFVTPPPVAIPILDPPADGKLPSLGMVFQEELSVRTTNVLDRDGFYFSPRPRAALNQIPMDIYVDAEGTGVYQLKTWADANPDFTSDIIQPPINRDEIPPEGRVLTEVIVGHKAPDGGYPQLFDFRSSGYVRFAGYPPQITGATMRVAAHKIFSQGAPHEAAPHEDFPVIRALFISITNSGSARALALIESRLFCGATVFDLNEGGNAEIIADNYFFMRTDFTWKKDPHSAFVAYSSMVFRTAQQTLHSDPSGQAHDSDTLSIAFKGGKKLRYTLAPPPTGLRIQDFAAKSSQPVAEWTLANEDRNPEHYARFAPALGTTNYDKRVSYRVSILDSNVKTGMSLYEEATNAEYADNVVAASTIRQDIKKAKSPAGFVHFKYKTTAFYP